MKHVNMFLLLGLGREFYFKEEERPEFFRSYLSFLHPASLFLKVSLAQLHFEVTKYLYHFFN